MPKKHRVFLSYSSANLEKASQLANYLKAQSVTVFMSNQLEGGALWEDSIQSALRNAKNLVILASPQSNNSDWVKFEAGFASGAKLKIIPVLYRCEEKDLPQYLRKYQTIDFDDMSGIVEALE
jgi:hypothetical protein